VINSTTHLSLHHRPGGLRNLHVLAQPEVHQGQSLLPRRSKASTLRLARTWKPVRTIKAENLRLIDWPASMPLQGAFANTQPLVGRIVLYPLAAGEPILERQLSSPGSGNGITVKIPDGMRALALRTDDVVGVAGFMLPGTHADVMVTLHPSNSPDPVTTTVLQDVQVLATGQKTEPDPDGKPVTATVVTILDYRSRTPSGLSWRRRRAQCTSPCGTAWTAWIQ